jgi:hypothetical protein
MEMMNIGGSFFNFLFTVASLRCAEEQFSTRLGRLVLWSVVLYNVRAVGEVVMFPSPSAASGVVCLAVAALYAVPAAARTAQT